MLSEIEHDYPDEVGQNTTIQISKHTLRAIIRLKIHPRETYDDVLRRIIDKKEATP